MANARLSTIWALALLVSAGAAQAAEPAAGNQEGLNGLQGFISSERGEPLVGAIVSVFGAHLQSGLITVSDENGNFGITDLPPGLYTLRAYLSGFLPSRSSSVEVTEEGEVVEPVSVKLARLQIPTASEAGRCCGWQRESRRNGREFRRKRATRQ